MSDHRMSEPPKDLRVLLEIDRNNNEPYLAGGERFLDDPWGSPYRLVCEDKRWRVVSNGPDGVVAEAHVVTGGGFWTAADWEVHAGRALCGGFEVPFH